MTGKPEFKLEEGELLIDGKSFGDISYEIAHSENVVEALVEKLNSIGPALRGLGQAEFEALVDEIEGIEDAGLRKYALQLFMSFTGKEPDEEGKVFTPFDQGDPVDWKFTPVVYPGSGEHRPIPAVGEESETGRSLTEGQREYLVRRAASINVQSIENTLVRLDPKKFEPSKRNNTREGGMWVRPELRDALEDMIRKVDADKKDGVDRTVSFPITVVSGYRVLGTSAASDNYGWLDSSDEDGHWDGRSIDLATKEWRLYRVTPPLADLFPIDPEQQVLDSRGDFTETRTTEDKSRINELDFIAIEAGLFRPIKKADETHWTLTDSMLPRRILEKRTRKDLGKWGAHTYGSIKPKG